MPNFLRSPQLANLFRSKTYKNEVLPAVGVSSLKPLRPKLPLKVIVSAVILLLLVVGGASAMILSQLQQDVRQRATGCTYWNGQPAVEGAVDNRGGVRQQCVNGYWAVPSDGNTDPSEIIAAQQAAKPKEGCTTWDGQSVAHGSYDIRGDIRQQCLDGYWDFPDDRITDPNDTASIALADAVRTIGTGGFDLESASDAFDQYCVKEVETDNVDFCQSLKSGISAEESRLALERQRASSDRVSYAIGGVDRGTLNLGDATIIYNQNCRGETALGSESVCKALNDRLNEMRNESGSSSPRPSSPTRTITSSFSTSSTPRPSTIPTTVRISSTPRPSAGGSISTSPRPSGIGGIFSSPLVSSRPFSTFSPGIFSSPKPKSSSSPRPSGGISNDAGVSVGGPCCVNGEYQANCSATDFDFVPRNADECRLRNGASCSTNDDCGSEGKCIVSPYGRYCVSQGTGNFGGCGDGICSADAGEDLAACSVDCNINNSRIRCLANECIDGHWCEENGYLSRSTECGLGNNCGSIADGACNIESYRCVNGDLYYNSSCADEAAKLKELKAKLERGVDIVQSLLPAECAAVEEEFCQYSISCDWTGAVCAPVVQQDLPSCTCDGYGTEGSIGDTLVFNTEVFGEDTNVNRTCVWFESRNSCTWTVARDGGVVSDEQLANQVIAVDESVRVFEPETRRNLQRAIELEEQYGVELNFVNAITDDDIAMLERSLAILEEAGYLDNHYGNQPGVDLGPLGTTGVIDLGPFGRVGEGDEFPLEVVLYNNADPDRGGGGVTYAGNGGVIYVGGGTEGQAENDYSWATEVMIHEAAHNNEGDNMEGFVEALAEDGFEVLPETEKPVGSDFCYSSTDTESWACGVAEYWVNHDDFCANYANTCEYLENEVFND